MKRVLYELTMFDFWHLPKYVEKTEGRGQKSETFLECSRVHKRSGAERTGERSEPPCDKGER